MFKKTQVCTAVLAVVGGVAGLAGPSLVLAQAPAPAASAAERITVTGTRILRADLLSTSPMTTISGVELQANQDITLDTALNSLPQVNPASGTTSNNPGNSGQSNVDLRGLGSNRNLVLVDGRRAMVSASNQTVDLNTIPLSLIDSIEVITGGAGAVYGADAVAGVVNLKLKRRFEGLDLRAGYSNSTEYRDAKERNVSALLGGNFAGNRGNAVVSLEYSAREGLIKSQRPFAKVATSTTTFFPEGSYRPTGNNLPSAAAVDALYGQASYGNNPAGTVPQSAFHSFNSDGSLFYAGIFNSPRDVVNFRYPIDDGVNTKFFPDFYSYNFDAVNILVLPLERRSMMGKFEYTLGSDVEVFANVANTRYTSRSALAPTPFPTVTTAAPGRNTATQAQSALITPGSTVANAMVVPTTNPFIPADLATLLASRTGDNPALVGSGATEPFLMRWRTLGAGLRTAEYENTISQYTAGAKGPLFGSGWFWEAYLSEGRTKITNAQGGNIDTNRVLGALAAADGGASQCAGGINPFGRQPLSPACVSYLTVSNTITNTFDQSIGQVFATGDIAQLPAGSLTAAVGAEFRNFRYSLDPGSAGGPISGFTTQSPAGGKNGFDDIFGELSIPLVRNAPFARSMNLSLAARSSRSSATDLVTGVTAPANRASTYAMNLDWEPVSGLRARGSVQRAVRAPNFGELFDGGNAAPQIFDPCSINTVARTQGPNTAAMRVLCRDAHTQFGGGSAGLGSAVDIFVGTPGTQATIETAGNVALKPENGTSYTFGLVWAPRGSPLSGSIDFYRIDVKKAITVPDSNEYIADCYNYYGRNPTYDTSYSSCRAVGRFSDILAVSDPNTADGAFSGTNEGRLQTAGIDVAVGWEELIGPGRLTLGLNLNYLLSAKQKTRADLPEHDFKGTIPYFGAGLGQAFPKIKSTLSARYAMGPFTIDGRLRYIDKMSNRMGIIFPGEVYTGVAATTYVDLGSSWEFAKGMTVRVGLNNALDQEARTYAPNVQSGTDPSTYDVIGRRLFLQLQAQFK